MKRREILTLTGVILVSVIVALLVAKTYIPKANVGWDEASQTHVAYRIYDSARAKSVLTFLKVTLSQVYYPPLQSWSYGLPLLPFGFSIEKARILGLFWLVFGGLVIFILGRQLGEKRGKLVGLLSLFFFLSSPMVLFFEAAVSFLFAKNRREIFFYHLALFAPFLLLLGFWLFFPYNKLSSYISIVTSPVGFQTRGMTDFWGVLLFYPRAIILMYSSSPILGIFLLFSFLISLN